ncbi:MAG: caspase family protein [Bauldia sp.]
MAQTTYAILVGVSDYWNLDPDLRLKGPRNDVKVMARLLADQGVPPRNIKVLADGARDLPPGVENAGDPTRSAILAALDALPHQVKRTDRVVFYFSGHGSRQPDQNGDEPSGLDEIFLPIDVGRWDARNGTVAGAIVDDELGRRVDAIRTAGADVFAIIDACHAAGGFRAIGEAEVRTRSVAPRVLGIPAATPPPPGLTREPLAADPPASGRSAFLYAAQSYERAEERPLAGPDEWDGVFTLALAKRIRQTPGASFRQLLEGVVADLKTSGIGAGQTPDLEGTMLDDPAFGAPGAIVPAGWRVSGGRLSAGVLDGVTQGSVVALYADPTAPDTAALGFAAVEATQPLTADLRPIVWPCTPAANGLCPRAPDAAPLAAARVARLVSLSADLALRVSAPRRLDPNDGRNYAAILAAYDRLSQLAPTDLGRLRLGEATYDVGLVLTDGVIALTDGTGVVDANGTGSSPRLVPRATPEAGARQILDALQAIARVNALYRAAGAASAARGSRPVAAKVTVRRATPAERAANRCPIARMPAADTAQPLGPGVPLAHCDLVAITLENRSATPQDVTVLYVDASFAIFPLFPEQGAGNRLGLGDKVELPIRVTTREADGRPAPTGEERIVVLAVPVEPGASRRAVLTGLSQPGLLSRSLGSDPVSDFLAEAMDTGRTVSSAPAGAKLTAEVISLLILADGANDAKQDQRGAAGGRFR